MPALEVAGVLGELLAQGDPGRLVDLTTDGEHRGGLVEAGGVVLFVHGVRVTREPRPAGSTRPLGTTGSRSLRGDVVT